MPRSKRSRGEGLKTSVGAVYRFRRELLAHWRPLTAALLCSLAYSAARLAEPWPLKVIFDNALAGMPLQPP